MFLSWLVACTAPAPPTTPTTPTSPTTPTDRCAGLQGVPIAMCAATDAPQLDTDSGDPIYPDLPAIYTFSGTLSEVSLEGALPAAPGATRVQEYEDCAVLAIPQVRILDENGYTWTLGWGPPPEHTEDSLALLEVGAALDFSVRTIPQQSHDISRGLLLSDEDGPLVLVEEDSVLTVEEQGFSVKVHVDSETDCDSELYPHTVYHLTTVSSSSDSIDLYNGETATLTPDVGSRELTFFLGLASLFTYECGAGCYARHWAAWALP